MIHLIQVIPVNDESYKCIVILVVAILIISLVINAFLASDLRSFSSPPLRVKGYISSNGDPMPGYYQAPSTTIGIFESSETGQSCQQG